MIVCLKLTHPTQINELKVPLQFILNLGMGFMWKKALLLFSAEGVMDRLEIFIRGLETGP